MELSESCLKYLTNYYLLEETRNEAKQVLRGICDRLYALVDERLSSNSTVTIEKYMHSESGSIWFTLSTAPSALGADRMSGWKYAVVYNDATQNEDLSEPTKGAIDGFTAQKNSSQIGQVRARAKAMKQEDPYRDATEINLLGGSIDEAASRLADVFEGYYNDYVRVVQSIAADVE